MISACCMIILLALGHGARSEESTLELGSGELEVQTTPAPTIYLIDDNGDIPTSFANLSNLPDNITSHSDIDPVTVVNLNAEEMKGNESLTLKTNITGDGVMTENPPQFPAVTTFVVMNETTVHPTEELATEISTESDSTSTTPEITVTSTITTEIPSTFDETSTVNMKQTTTTSTKQTTTYSSTTAMTGKSDKSTGHNPKRQQDEDRNICVFLNPDFECSREVVCFGEGEIDCDTGEDQIIMDKISLSSSTSEDYEYEVPESDTIGTFPPYLVGVGTSKKISFYNMQSFTTDTQMEEASKAVENSSADMGETTENVTPYEVNKASEAVKNDAKGPAVTTESTSTMESTENPMPVADGAGSVVEMAENKTKESASTTQKNPPLLESTETATFETTSLEALFPKIGSAGRAETGNDGTMVTLSPQDSVGESNAKPEEPVKKTEKVRRRRGFFSSNSDLTPEAKKKLAVEYLQRKYLNPTCRLTGNIQCMPMPTTANCRGKTFCQATLRKSETAESSKAKGLEIWMIVVIVICGLFGFMTIGMITYLIIHSCKKLKVQPAHDVTPLNYITKKAENAETA